MAFEQLLPYIGWAIAAVAAISIGGIFAAVHNTRLKIKHGYPLEGMWGQSLKPAVTTEAMERVKLLTQENAQLRAEIGSLHDRMISVERIVTDAPDTSTYFTPVSTSRRASRHP